MSYSMKKVRNIYIEIITASWIVLASTMLPIYAQQIIPNGFTGNRMPVNGNQTIINTGIVKGNNAINSFNKVNVNNANVVNPVLQANTQNLNNVVRNQTSVINGTINSSGNGSIGGNINLNSIIAGQKGSVNVGSLTTTAPTREFVNNFVNTQAKPDSSGINTVLNKKITNSIQASNIINSKVNDINNINNRPEIKDLVNIGAIQEKTNIIIENNENNNIVNPMKIVTTGPVIPALQNKAGVNTNDADVRPNTEAVFLKPQIYNENIENKAKTEAVYLNPEIVDKVTDYRNNTAAQFIKPERVDNIPKEIQGDLKISAGKNSTMLVKRLESAVIHHQSGISVRDTRIVNLNPGENKDISDNILDSSLLNTNSMLIKRIESAVMHHKAGFPINDARVLNLNIEELGADMPYNLLINTGNILVKKLKSAVIHHHLGVPVNIDRVLNLNRKDIINPEEHPALFRAQNKIEMHQPGMTLFKISKYNPIDNISSIVNLDPGDNGTEKEVQSPFIKTMHYKIANHEPGSTIDYVKRSTASDPIKSNIKFKLNAVKNNIDENHPVIKTMEYRINAFQNGTSLINLQSINDSDVIKLTVQHEIQKAKDNLTDGNEALKRATQYRISNHEDGTTINNIQRITDNDTVKYFMESKANQAKQNLNLEKHTRLLTMKYRINSYQNGTNLITLQTLKDSDILQNIIVSKFDKINNIDDHSVIDMMKYRVEMHQPGTTIENFDRLTAGTPLNDLLDGDTQNHSVINMSKYRVETHQPGSTQENIQRLTAGKPIRSALDMDTDNQILSNIKEKLSK